jgi:uncharacterized protein (TIGR03066 family)
MRALWGSAVVLALVCAVSTAQDKKDEKYDVKKLIGKWETGDKKLLVLIEFAAEGKLLLTAGEPGKEIKAEGTYKLQGDKLDVSLKFMGDELKEQLTIKKLTDQELITEDSKGKSETLKRKK